VNHAHVDDLKSHLVRQVFVGLFEIVLSTVLN